MEDNKSFEWSTNARFDLLIRPIFLISLALLLANDLYLKYKYANWGTGKLSDFAGLFMFPYFIATFRIKIAKEIYIISAFLFFFWKSESSQFIIEYFQNLGIGINRIIDSTDLVALLVLPVSYKYLLVQSKKITEIRKILIVSLSGICLFAILATSLRREEVILNLPIGKTYGLQISKSNFFKSMRAGTGDSDTLSKNLTDSIFYLYFDISDYNARLTALSTITAIDTNTTFIRLDTILSADITGGLFRAPDKENIKSATANQFQKNFEKDFLEAVKSDQTQYILRQ